MGVKGYVGGIPCLNLVKGLVMTHPYEQDIVDFNTPVGKVCLNLLLQSGTEARVYVSENLSTRWEPIYFK